MDKFNVVMIIAAILLISFGLFSGTMVNEKVAVNCLEVQGYSDIKVIDHAWFFIPFRGGDRGDSARFHMRAVNPAGKEVDVYVFSGWLFKGATIRTM